MSIKNIAIKVLTVLSISVWVFFLFVILYGILRVFVVDVFPVNSSSMYPTIQPGDKVYVNKLIFGARIYKNLDFLDSGHLATWRMKGIRKIKRNDVVLLNYPSEGDIYPTRFVINSVYVKRCIGLPGDSLVIEGGIYRNLSIRDTLGLHRVQVQNSDVPIEPAYLRSYPHDDLIGWTVKDFGPLYIPRSGDTLPIDDRNFRIYHKYIVYETGKDLWLHNDTAYLAGQPLYEYVFRDSYYFMAGDNVMNSADSRYFGLIPEEFIVGVVPHILYSRDPYTRKIRRDRILKPL